MKKFLFVLLSLAVVGAAFAADAPSLKFSGAVKAGIQLTSNDSTTPDAVYAYNDDAGKLNRVELVGAYTDGDFGVKFRFRSDDFAAPSFSYGYVWGNLFAKKVLFKAGSVDDGAWATKGDTGYDVADGKGVLVQVVPIEGLNVGVRFDLSGSKATAGSGATEGSTILTGYSYKQFFNETSFGAGYTSNLFNAQAGIRLDSDFSENDVSDDGAAATTLDDCGYYYGGFSYTGMKDLVAIFEAKKYYSGNSDYGYIEANETFEYPVIEKLTAGILLYQYSYSDSDIEPALSFNPYVNYALNEKTTVGVGVYYGMQDEASEIYVKPNATYVFGPKAKAVGFFKYDISDSGVSGVDAVATSTFQLDFIYSF